MSGSWFDAPSLEAVSITRVLFDDFKADEQAKKDRAFVEAWFRRTYGLDLHATPVLLALGAYVSKCPMCGHAISVEEA